MKKYSIAIVLALLCIAIQPLAAQQPISWSEKPTISEIDDKYKREPAVLVVDYREKELMTNPSREEVYFIEKEQKVIKLNDALGLESYNKFILSDGNSYEIYSIKARTIKQNGKVYEVKDIKTNSNEYGGKQYHIAFENLSIGDDIELLIESKRPLSYFGSEVFQKSIPIINASFTFIMPDVLEYEFKSFNGFPNVDVKTVDGLRIYHATHQNIPAMKEELYADPKLHEQRIEYKLSYASSASSRVYTWNDFAKVLNDIFYSKSSAEDKAIKKFIKDLNVDGKLTTTQKINKLETYIKTNIVINDNLGDEYVDIEKIVANKTTSKKGVTKLYVASLEELGIKHEVGMVSNKFEAQVDEQFENWNHLEHYLIYILDDKKYLVPAFDNLRYPAVTPMLEDVKAVFAKRLSHGGVTTAVSVFRTLPMSTYDKNYHNIVAEIHFDEDFLMNLNVVHSLNGLSAVGYREMVTYLPAKDEKAFLMQILDVPEMESDIVSYTFKNKGLEYYTTQQPIEIEAELKLDNLAEKAGNKYLVHIGKIIGPQQEMYKVEERVLPISIPSAHRLQRDIIIRIPKGYTIANPEVVLINKDYGADKYGFITKYTLEKDMMIIHLDEYYSKLVYDKSLIEEFRSVINAAADFNKVTLVFEKI